MANTYSDTLLTPRDVSDILGVKINTLAVWRSTQRYPLEYIKAGRSIRYTKESVDEFIRSRTVSPLELQEADMKIEDCPKWISCGAPICPVDEHYLSRVHIAGEKICFYLNVRFIIDLLKNHF